MFVAIGALSIVLDDVPLHKAHSSILCSFLELCLSSTSKMIPAFIKREYRHAFMYRSVIEYPVRSMRMRNSFVIKDWTQPLRESRTASQRNFFFRR